MRKFPYAMAILVVFLGLTSAASAATRHEANVAAWKPYGPVEGFEYKFPMNPDLFKTGIASASFSDIWKKLEAAAEQQGFKVSGRGIKIRKRTKVYFDTPELALKKAGFIIRINTEYKDGRADDKIRLSIKTSGKTPEFVLGTPLQPQALKGKVSAEDNPYLDAKGVIQSNVEKSVDFRTVSAELGNLSKPALKQFSRLVPDLLKSGLSPETALTPEVAYSYSAKMGTVDLAGTPAEVSLEAWTTGWDAKPVALELSYGVEDVDYYAIPAVVAAGDAFFQKVLLGPLKGMLMPDFDKFGGSKQRLMRESR